jgi:hypothetical protein
MQFQVRGPGPRQRHRPGLDTVRVDDEVPPGKAVKVGEADIERAPVMTSLVHGGPGRVRVSMPGPQRRLQFRLVHRRHLDGGRYLRGTRCPGGARPRRDRADRQQADTPGPPPRSPPPLAASVA